MDDFSIGALWVAVNGVPATSLRMIRGVCRFPGGTGCLGARPISGSGRETNSAKIRRRDPASRVPVFGAPPRRSAGGIAPAAPAPSQSRCRASGHSRVESASPFRWAVWSPRYAKDVRCDCVLKPVHPTRAGGPPPAMPLKTGNAPEEAQAYSPAGERRAERRPRRSEPALLRRGRAA